MLREVPCGAWPSHRPLQPPDEVCWSEVEGRRAAVALLFMPAERPFDDPYVILLRRSTRVATHKGQICLPGGLAEPGESPIQTAVRESSEELGVDPSAVRLFGGLPAQRSIDGKEVKVFLGMLDATPASLQPSEDESESMYLVSWRAVALDRSRAFEFNMFGHWRVSRLFEVAGQRVWGLTASILVSAGLEERNHGASD